MIETFSYRIETPKKSFHYTIHSVDIKTSVDNWIEQIEDLQNQIYSFDIDQVQNIKHQYSTGQLKTHFDKDPFFLTYKVDDYVQVVNIDKITKGLPDFIARVTYLTTQQGGRIGYAVSGYRPHIKFDGREYLTSGEQLFIDKEKVFPGETVTAEIRIVSTHVFKNYLFVGQYFEVSEGSRVVGHGEVIEIINIYLEKAGR